MRLTLRTLLAWLDDTLPPTQVREIGKQVNDSPFAQELVERIHRVCRQRRLTVPSRNGPDGTDPNIVAGYVDNDLDPDQVTEYEKKCLTSDVNLAEAACVHQILSLLGQKVHVPNEAKARMALLVKGRETIPPPRTDGARAQPSEPVTKPIQPWVAPEPPPLPWLERFGPALACLGLIGLLCWSAYHSLELSPTQTTTLTSSAPPTPEIAGKNEAAAGSAPGLMAGNPGAGADGTLNKLRSPEVRNSGTTEGTAKEAGPSEAATSESAKASAKPLPAGAVGIVKRAGGVLLRFNNESREWDRITDGAALASGDQLICLAPFQSRIQLGSTDLRLIGETRLRVLTKQPADPPTFELAFGRVVAEESPSPDSLRVEASGRVLQLDRESPETIGLERGAAWQFGRPASQPAPLAIHTPHGEVKLSIEQASRTLTGPGTMLVDASGQFQAVETKSIAGWVTTAELSEKEKKLGEDFEALFSRESHVLADIVSATENESPVAKKHAIMAIKALGDLTFLIPILSRPNDPSARQSTAVALREFLAQGTESRKQLAELLTEEYGEESAGVIEKLLVGYSPEETKEKETLEELVDHLSPREPSLAVRELALDCLMTITGRDAQGYDPENPEEKTYAAWKSLLNKGELKPVVRRKTSN